MLPPDVRSRYPFAGHHLRVNGWRMHYLDDGDPAADPVLLLHGNPTWSYLWRDVIPPLVAAGHRVVAPDHVGFGLSDKPTRAQDHSLANHVANPGALVDRLDLRRLTVVGQDWGGPIGLARVLLRPERVRALAVMSTWAWPAPPAEFHLRRFPWRVMHAPLSGPFLLGRHNALATRGVYLSVVDRDRFRAEGGQAAYEAVLDQPEERLLTWTFPRYIPLGPESAATAFLARLEAGLRGLPLPVLVVWGREDDVFPASFAERFLETFPNASGAALGDRQALPPGRLGRRHRPAAGGVPGGPAVTAADVTFVDALPDGAWRRVTVLREDDLGHYDEFRRFLAAALGLEGRGVPAEPALVRAGSGAFYELVVVGRAGAPLPSGVEVAAVLADFAALDDDAVDADLWALLRWLYAGVGEGWDVADLEATGRPYRLPFAAVPEPPSS